MAPGSIIVAGGGIGGLAVALALSRCGRTVRVLEKAAEFGEVGAGLQLAPNASWALDRLGVLPAVRTYAVAPSRIMWMDALSGERLTSLDLGANFVERYGFPYLVMHRSDLLDALLQACQRESGITLETNKDVSGVEDRGSSVCVRCADGTSYEADVLVGADGLWSTIRTAIEDDGRPICSQYVAYRGAIPMNEMSEHAGLDNVMLWTGPDMHLVQYPLRSGELYNQVAVFKSSRYSPETEDWGTAEELDEHFAGGAPLVASALAKIKRNRRWPMFDRLPIPSWTRNRITLLGDAAHPMLQYLAQGAAQALEDGVVFADALDAHAGDIDAGIGAYQTERAARTSHVQTLARAWGEYWHLHPGPALDARNAFLRARAPDDFSRTDWFYGYRGMFAAAK
ncbi:MAG: 3-hydroxybenzoate 6-monooxygenase [Candidatus Velthaea sp.]